MEQRDAVVEERAGDGEKDQRRKEGCAEATSSTGCVSRHSHLESLADELKKR